MIGHFNCVLVLVLVVSDGQWSGVMPSYTYFDNNCDCGHTVNCILRLHPTGIWGTKRCYKVLVLEYCSTRNEEGGNA